MKTNVFVLFLIMHTYISIFLLYVMTDEETHNTDCINNCYHVFGCYGNHEGSHFCPFLLVFSTF